MVVYLDVVFLINFAFDAGLLAILLRLNSKAITPGRLLLAALIGGLEGTCAFIPQLRPLASLPAGLLISLTMTAIVLMPCRAAECIKGWLLFLAAAFVLSGSITYLGIKAAWGLFLLPPAYLLTCRLKRAVQKKSISATLFYGGRSVTAEGFFDSGNRVTYRGVPVILGNDRIFTGLFGSGFSINAAAEWVSPCDLCAVPYAALGKSGVIIGVRLDRAVIDGKEYREVILGHFSDNFAEDLILNGTITY